MKNIEFLESCRDDYAAIAEIYNEHIQLKQSTMDEGKFTADSIFTWISRFHSREKIYVLKKDHLLIGWGIIKRYSDREGYGRTCETAVYLRSEERGKGYGSFIKKELIKICKKLNYHHLVAKIFADNKASIVYNEKLGYEIVGRQKEIGYRDGKWIDIIIMQYIIK